MKNQLLSISYFPEYPVCLSNGIEHRIEMASISHNLFSFFFRASVLQGGKSVKIFERTTVSVIRIWVNKEKDVYTGTQSFISVPIFARVQLNLQYCAEWIISCALAVPAWLELRIKSMSDRRWWEGYSIHKWPIAGWRPIASKSFLNLA